MAKGGKKSAPKRYDVIVIGAGSAGFGAALAARAEGARVCVIEEAKLGGECPNWGCIPSKAMLRAAKAYREVLRAHHFGIHVPKVQADFSAVMKYQQSVVARVTGGGERGDRYVKTAKQQGIDVVFGHATFTSKHILEVCSPKNLCKRLYGKTFVIATGTTDFVPPIDGLSETPFWGYVDVMKNTQLPKTLGVVGAGPVGCELATVFATFGTQVVLLQGAPKVLHREDTDVSDFAQKSMEKLGMSVHTGVKIDRVSYSKRGNGSFTVSFGKQEVRVEKLLVATGKRPNTLDLGLQVLDLEVDGRGYILIDETQKTSVPHVFAAGDITDTYQFTHTAHPAGDVAGKNAVLAAKKKKLTHRFVQDVVPRATFVDPEVASVGMTVEQVKEKYKHALVGSFRMDYLGRGATDKVQPGVCKLVAHPKTRRVLGGHMIGEHAGEVIHEVALAIKMKAKVDDLASLIHAFPTYSEAVGAAAHNMNVV